MTATLTEPTDTDEETDAGPAAEGKPRRRVSQAMLIELVLLPLIVVVGFLAYTVWRNTASLDSIETSSLAWKDVFDQLLSHIKLTVVASAAVVLIAVPLGVLLTRPKLRRAAPAVVAVANAGQAIPSIGLIVLLFIWLSRHGWDGFWTAILALTLYGLLPVLRNTIVGIQAVDPTLVEAGRGLGWSNATVLFRVELPLAIPVIMTGVRTALILVVGTASLATFINGGGLGGVLNAGITLYRYPVIIAGGVLIALLALLVEWLGRLLELVARPKGI